MNDDQYFLANAYLDGELTDEERRLAAADPDVMAEVEQLRALQAEIRDVPPPSAAVRETAIAAAMAEFEPRATESPEAAPVVAFRPRPAYSKYLAVAAALVAVAGLGIVISQADLGGDDDDAGTAVEDAALSESPARPDDVVNEVQESDAAESGAESAPTDVAAADDMGGSDASSGNTGAAATEETAEEAAEEMAEEAAGGDGPAFSADAENTARILVPADFDPDKPILNEIALAIYGSYLLDQVEFELLGPTPETVCAGDYEILDTATYVLDGDDRTVYVAVNKLEGFVFALDVDTCTELAMGSLF